MKKTIKASRFKLNLTNEQIREAALECKRKTNALSAKEKQLLFAKSDVELGEWLYDTFLAKFKPN